MIQGLQLTVTGKQIKDLLAERIDVHRNRAERWKHELSRTPADETEAEPLLPDQMCEHERQRSEWRAAVLEFIREHVDETATYLLSQADLEFGELLPERPRSVEQEEYEERTALAFNIDRLTKRLGGLPVTALDS